MILFYQFRRVLFSAAIDEDIPLVHEDTVIQTSQLTCVPHLWMPLEVPGKPLLEISPSKESCGTELRLPAVKCSRLDFLRLSARRCDALQSVPFTRTHFSPACHPA